MIGDERIDIKKHVVSNESTKVSVKNIKERAN